MSFRLLSNSGDPKVIPVLWSLDSVTLTGRQTPRLDRVTLQIQSGVTAVLGQSGAGKTSLLNLLVGFERPTSGRFVSHFQSSAPRLPFFWGPPHHGLWPHLTVREHLTTVSPVAGASSIAAADSLLEQFDLQHRSAAKPDSLSLGERSRLNVARALCSGAAVLVMDEPLSNVDSARSSRYWNVVRAECARVGTSLIFATHSSETVLREADQVICLADGKLIYAGDVETLYERPATPGLAALLGPMNWLTFNDVQQWCVPQSDSIASATEHSACVRPEQLMISSASEGPLQVQEARFSGTTEEVDLLHESTGERRSFVTRPRGQRRIRPGDRVALKLLTLLFMTLCCGCWGAGPTLSVTKETDWFMPPDGARVPAPRGMTVTPRDEYLVLDNAGRVLVFNGEGDLQRQWWMPEYSVGKAEGICELKDGRIAVADTHYHRVVFFDHDGQVTSTIGKRGSDPGDFVYPVAVIQDPDENIYVCEYGRNDRVQKFRPDGTFLLQFGGTGTELGQFQRPSGIVWCDHKLYVVDAFNHRIQVFTEDGKFAGILGGTDKMTELYYPYDIAIDKNSDLFVVEYGAGRVSKFSREGRLLGQYGTTGRGQQPGEFSTPWSLAFDNRGRLYICDTGNRRIVELQL